MIKHRALLVQEGLNFDELSERIKRKQLRYNSIFESNSVMYKLKNEEFTKRGIEELSDLDEDLCELINNFIYEKQEAEEEFKNPKPIVVTPDVTVIAQPKKEKSFLGLF